MQGKGMPPLPPHTSPGGQEAPSDLAPAPDPRIAKSTALQRFTGVLAVCSSSQRDSRHDSGGPGVSRAFALQRYAISAGTRPFMPLSGLSV